MAMKHHHRHHHHQQQTSSSSPSSSSLFVSLSSTSISLSTSDSPAAMSSEDPSPPSTTATSGQDSIVIDRRTDFSAICRWTVSNYPKIRVRSLWSKYFEIGGFDCRFLVYPKVLASEDDQDALTTDELLKSEDSEGISGDEEDIFRNLLSRAGFHLTYADGPSEPQVILGEKLLMDAGAIAGFLTGLRVYLDDPAKVKCLLLPTKLSGASDGKVVSKSDESSPSLMNLLMGVKVLQQAIIDLLLDIMVECCQPSEENFSEDVNDERSKGSMDDSGATSTLQSERENPLFERLDSAVSERVNSVAVHIARTSTGSETSDTDVHETAVPGLPTHPPETSACTSSETASLHSKTKWPEQSEELLGLIINSLRALDGVVPQSCPQPRRRPQSAQKIALILDKAPKHLQPDLVALVPKLVEHAEHPLAAAALLERFQKPDAEPALRLPVFDALSQLECSGEVWECVLFQSFPLLGDSNDESLATTINFIFKAATQCQHLQEAVRSVRVRLKQLGAEVSPCVLDFLSRTVHSWADVSEAILRDIDSDVDCGANCPSVKMAPLVMS